MVLDLLMSPEAQAKLEANAKAAGVDVGIYAARELERIVTRPSLDEVLAPLRDQFDQSGMTEAELVDLLEDAKHAARAERRARQTL